MPFMFGKLEVYQRAVDFADEIASLTESFPRAYGFLVDQLNRAALSIATNLAEGNGRFTKPTTGSSVMPGRLGPSLIDRQQKTSPSPAILPENGEVARRALQSSGRGSQPHDSRLCRVWCRGSGRIPAIRSRSTTSTGLATAARTGADARWTAR
jgi:23S rRNA-intervening sequence protein